MAFLINENLVPLESVSYGLIKLGNKFDKSINISVALKQNGTFDKVLESYQSKLMTDEVIGQKKQRP